LLRGYLHDSECTLHARVLRMVHPLVTPLRKGYVSRIMQKPG
jgi:hypothetical protein